MSKICLLKSTFDSRHVSLGNRLIGTGAREEKHRQKQEDSAVRRVLTASGTSRRVEMKFDDGVMLHISCCEFIVAFHTVVEERSTENLN